LLGSKYTISINTEMNDWPAEITNLSELHAPLLDLIETAREDGRRIAKFYCGAGGFVLRHNTDLWGRAVPIDGARWGHLVYGRGMAIAASRRPLRVHARSQVPRRTRVSRKEGGDAVLNGLSCSGRKGHLVTGPSTSPENEYRLPSKEKAVLCHRPDDGH
jgi:alpha-L-fucosidase 2